MAQDTSVSMLADDGIITATFAHGLSTEQYLELLAIVKSGCDSRELRDAIQQAAGKWAVACIIDQC